MANSPETIKVEVVYLEPDNQFLKILELPKGKSVMDAVVLSGVSLEFPHLDLTQAKLGIFGRIVERSDLLADADRVEIYRSLLVDPKEARRRRAEGS